MESFSRPVKDRYSFTSLKNPSAITSLFLFLKLRCLYGEDVDFHNQAHKMLGFLFPPTRLSRSCSHFALEPHQLQALTPEPPCSSGTVKLVLSHHSHSLAAKEILFGHLHLLQAEPDTREFLGGTPIGGLQTKKTKEPQGSTS